MCSLHIIYFIIVGLIGGAILASTGVIGPFLIPTLLFLGLPSGVARGTTLVSEIPLSLICVIGHKKERNIDKRVTLALLPGAVFVVLGANLSVQVPELPMKLLIGIAEMVIGITLIYKAVKWVNTQSSVITVKTKTDIAKLMTAAVFAGLAKGFFGLGWGPISVGLLVLLGIKSKIAVGSSLVIRFLLGCFGGVTYASMNLVNINVAIVLALAGAVIALPAIKLTTEAKEEKFRAFLGGIITFLGALVIINTMTLIH
jgi:uncharacterized membrane protein YfcA